MKILVPVDESFGSQQALGIVEKLARAADMGVTLLTVCRPDGADVARPDIPLAPMGVGGLVGPDIALDPKIPARGGQTKVQALDATEAEARDYLADLAAALEREGVHVDTRVVLADDVAAAIVRLAEDQGYDLIAMSTHGRGGLDELLHGSVARSVLKAGTVPVILVRPQGW